MRIVYAWDADYPWDVRTEKVCAALTAAGHDVHVAARNRGWKASVERLAEGTVHRMPPWRALGRRIDGALGFPAFFNPRWVAHLWRTVRRARADVLVVRDLPLCPTAIWAARRAGIPLVFDMAEHYPAMVRQAWTAGRAAPLDVLVRNPRAVAAVERWCLPRVDRVITVIPESAARVIAMGVPAARVSVVNNTPPISRVHETAPRPARAAGEPLHLVYMGLMEVSRGIQDVVDAVALLAARGVEVRTTLIGGGRDLDLLRAHAHSLGLRAPVIDFTGWMPSHAEALRRVADADVGLLPHRRCEGWDATIPNKLFDYMAAGLAIASTDPLPTARIVRETGCGLVVPSRAPAAMADALVALRDPALRTRLGAAGRAAIVHRYHWEADAAVLVREVESAAARPPGRAPATPSPVLSAAGAGD